ncbi:MAG: helix-turn-helix domain-containing protein [Nitrospirota bacterium]|nr:helix-turn-helix domain-containing protein [Nitrospirota bacterium]
MSDNPDSAREREKARRALERKERRAIRRANLNAVLDELSKTRFRDGRGAVNYIATVIGTSPSYVSTLKNTDTRGITDRFARKIEQAIGRNEGWMDEAPQQPPPVHAAGTFNLIPKALNAEVAGRAGRLLAGLSHEGWAAMLNVTPGQIIELTHGRALSTEVLAALARVENVSLNWLLYGNGSPYTATAPDTDPQVAATLREYLAEGGADDGHWWSIHLLRAEHGACVVLTRPGHLVNAQGGWIDFTEVRVLAGNLGRTALNQVRQEVDKGTVSLVEATPEQLSRLRGGGMGNRELLSLCETGSSLTGPAALPYAGSATTERRASEADQARQYGVDLLSPEEAEQIRLRRSLPPEELARFNEYLRRFFAGQKNGKT